MERILIANRIQTPDGTILHSKHRHDFVCHIDKVNGERYCVDGGNYYQKISFEKNPPIDCSIYSTDDFEEVRKVFLRGMYGKNGNEPLHYISLCEMSEEWIFNVIKCLQEIEPHVTDYDSITNQEVFLELYHKELDYRYDRQILIED